VISKNLHRRHLDESQRQMVAAKIANLSHGVRADRAANLPVLTLTQAEAAKMMNVSERGVRDAKKVRDNGSKLLIKAVEDGKIAVSVAAKLAALSAATQNEAVADPDKASHIVKGCGS
jgi:hypothetical protein